MKSNIFVGIDYPQDNFNFKFFIKFHHNQRTILTLNLCIAKHKQWIMNITINIRDKKY